jgi:hypothetical protein
MAAAPSSRTLALRPACLCPTPLHVTPTLLPVRPADHASPRFDLDLEGALAVQLQVGVPRGQPSHKRSQRAEARRRESRGFLRLGCWARVRGCIQSARTPGACRAASSCLPAVLLHAATFAVATARLVPPLPNLQALQSNNKPYPDHGVEVGRLGARLPLPRASPAWAPMLPLPAPTGHQTHAITRNNARSCTDSPRLILSSDLSTLAAGECPTRRCARRRLVASPQLLPNSAAAARRSMTSVSCPPRPLCSAPDPSPLPSAHAPPQL